MDKINTIVVDLGFAIDKKQRNMQKRKGKLDQYKDSLNKGAVLKADQAKAVEKYECVTSSITLLSEVADTINAFCKQMKTEVADTGKRLEAQKVQETKSALMKQMVLMNFVDACKVQAVMHAIKCECTDAELNSLKNLLELLETKVVPKSGVVFTGTEEDAHARTQILFNFVSSSNQLIPNAKTPKGSASVSYGEMQKLCFRLMQSKRVCCAIEGKPYEVKVEPQKSQSQHVVITTMTPEQLSNSNCSQSVVPTELFDNVINPVKSRFNFLHASSVSSDNIVASGVDVALLNHVKSNAQSVAIDQQQQQQNGGMVESEDDNNSVKENHSEFKSTEKSSSKTYADSLRNSQASENYNGTRPPHRAYNGAGRPYSERGGTGGMRSRGGAGGGGSGGGFGGRGGQRWNRHTSGGGNAGNVRFSDVNSKQMTTAGGH